jgi:hypothetical protein
MNNWQRAVLVLATLGTATVPAAAQADTVQAACTVDRTAINGDCGVAFTYGGGTLTVDASASRAASWYVANSDTYEVPCRGSLQQTNQTQSWQCTLPAGRFYLRIATGHSGSAGFIDVRW